MQYLQRMYAYVASLPRRIRTWPIWTWPNFLSVIRMLAVFPIGWLLAAAQFGVALCVYIVAMITDYFDGYTARRFNQITNFGKLLDPLADKVLHIYVLREFQFLHPEIHEQYGYIWKLAIILAVLPSFAYVLDSKRRLGSNIFGKTKLCVEVLAIGLLFLCNIPWSPNVAETYPLLFAISQLMLPIAGILLWVAVGLASCSILGHMLIKEGFDYRWWRKNAHDK